MISIFVSDGTWFDKGTIAIRLAEGFEGDGIFFGTRNGELDEEMCSINEFKEYTVKDGFVI